MALENKLDLATQDLALYKAKKLDEDLELNLSAKDLFHLYIILEKEILQERLSILRNKMGYDDFITQALEKKEASKSAFYNESLNQYLGNS